MTHPWRGKAITWDGHSGTMYSRVCHECGMEFFGDAAAQFCSASCMGIARRGKSARDMHELAAERKAGEADIRRFMHRGQHWVSLWCSTCEKRHRVRLLDILGTVELPCGERRWV